MSKIHVEYGEVLSEQVFWWENVEKNPQEKAIKKIFEQNKKI